MSEQENFQGISQETCDKLNRQFENLISCSKKYDEFIEQTMRHYMLTVLNSMMDKLEYYTKKMIKATFVTRWYWKRKIDKQLKKMDETSDAFKRLDEERKS